MFHLYKTSFDEDGIFNYAKEGSFFMFKLLVAILVGAVSIFLITMSGQTPIVKTELNTSGEMDEVSGVNERIEWENFILEGVPDIPQSLAARTAQYQNTRNAILYGWDPNGEGMLISTRLGETTQLYYVSDPGGYRQQLTFFEEPVHSAVLNPNPLSREFLFRKDVEGNEVYQLFAFNLTTGVHKLLTDGESRHGSMIWSNDGQSFAYYSTQRNGSDWDVFISKTENPELARMVHGSSGIWAPLAWSPDDQQLLIVNYISNQENYLHLLDVATETLNPITESDKQIGYGSVIWSPDGEGLYLTSDEGGEFQQLHYYDLETGIQTDLASDLAWDIEEFAISLDGTTLAFTTNQDGLMRLYLMDTNTFNYKLVSNIPLGLVNRLQFHPNGTELAFVLNTAQTPGDVYALRLSDQTLTRWTYSEVGGLNTDEFVIPELISYPTFDEVDGAPRQIPAFYYKPKGTGPHPVLIFIHGGPAAQFQPFFITTFPYYMNELGIAVLAPNVRGSTGYGRDYELLDNGYKREDSVKDIGALLDWIERQPELDASRVMVDGGSYGGYMVLASLVHYNDRLRGGITLSGFSSFITFLENTGDYRRDAQREEFGDERDQDMYEFLQKISPLDNAHKITKPVFIAQGLNDPRVPAGEAEQMVEAIRNNGSVVWYMLAKDEGHGFAKKSNLDYFLNALVLFLQEYLLKK